MKKILIIGAAVFSGVVLLAWFFIESSKALPGTKLADLGRKHVVVGEKVEYNSNPPASGSHFADWIRSGVYDQPKDDGSLVHSLEHGYVIISYDCGKKISSIGAFMNVYAHEGEDDGDESPSVSSVPATNSAGLSGDCKSLVDQLTLIYEKQGKKKLIVIPRPGMDFRVALTAWTYIDKFNDFDQGRIEKFIDAYRDQGPEKTTE